MQTFAMKTLFRILILAALVPTGAFAQTSAFTYQGTLNQQGAPANGNFEGDFYWKVYPRQAIQRSSGASTLWGLEANIFDADWATGSTVRK